MGAEADPARRCKLSTSERNGLTGVGRRPVHLGHIFGDVA